MIRPGPTARISPRPKIFCLGLHKTGTTSISRFFSANGIRSITMGGPYRAHNLAHTLLRNITAERPILYGLEQIEAFSDLNWMDGRFYLNEAVFVDRIVQEYPGAYFIYNNRELESWIRSRQAHHKGRFLRNYMKHYHVDEPTAIAMWREYYHRHRQRIMGSVDRVNGRILEFTIGIDQPEDLAAFLEPDYRLDVSLWSHHNESSIDTLQKRSRRMLACFFWSPPNFDRLLVRRPRA